MFWIIIGVMLATAMLVIMWPLYRVEKRFSVTAIASMVSVAVISATLYSQIGTPNPDSQVAAMPDINEMVSSLAQRLEENPVDLVGWKMLGRSYMQLENFPGAVSAFERAVEIESSENGQTLADLGEAILMGNPRELLGRAGQLFENALALTPGNGKALFYSGMAAAQRGDNLLAADRWEALLATSLPPNVADILHERIAELRGGAPLPEAAPTKSGPI
ncbi:MAG: tetratricopeptide repeat protein, partial [Woeseiaceae bacterium]|nr:tetratricopeptide repeat protein [Woeseiaceae bacterium]